MAESKAAIIIDDIGYGIKEIDYLKGIDFPLTTAIYPGYKYSTRLAKQSHKHGFEVFIHMPMEAIGGNNPGVNAIYVKMSDYEIINILKKNIKSVPYAVGINNHMGSKVTQDIRCMGVILSFLKQRGMIFVDSLVINNSVGREVANNIGLSFLARDVFLDNKDDFDYIKGQLEKLMELALKNGSAIGIGHVDREHTKDAINYMIPIMKEKGIKFCYASEVVK